MKTMEQAVEENPRKQGMRDISFAHDVLHEVHGKFGAILNPFTVFGFELFI